MKNIKPDVVQNLADAGCDAQMIAAVTEEFEKGNTAAALGLLEKQRKALLDAVHEREYCINCLDYLTYQINSKDFKPCTEN